MNKKLQEIGGKLNISDRDIQKIQKGYISNKLLAIIVGGIIAIIAFILWLVIGRETGPSPTPTPPPGGGYPFAPPSVIGGFLLQKKKNSKIAGLLILAISFLATLVATPVFGHAIMYNVYKRK